MSESAVAAALAVARKQGVRCDDPVVLREAWHVLLHLRPSPVVARVSSSIPFPHGPNPDDVVRELAVAAHCARAGCAVVPPADEVEAVPYRHGGHVVTFWRYVEPSDDPNETAAVRALREIHDALESYEGALPTFGHPADTAAMLDALPPSDDVELLREVTARRPDVAAQPLHGDAHLLNVLGTPRGPLWHDFETACRGPREYDLAALAENASLDAYGAYDHDLVEAMWPYYAGWVTSGSSDVCDGCATHRLVAPDLEGASMFSRVNFLQTTPERLPDVARVVRDVVHPGISGEPGYAGYIVLGNHETGRALGVTLWESGGARAASDTRARQIRPIVERETGGTMESVEQFEVLFYDVPAAEA